MENGAVVVLARAEFAKVFARLRRVFRVELDGDGPQGRLEYHLGGHRGRTMVAMIGSEREREKEREN